MFIALGAGACGDSPGHAWLVDRPRVLGARVQGGEVTWLVVAPAAPSRFAWSFAACAAPAGNYAAPRCAGAIASAGSGTSSGDEAKMPVGALPEPGLVLAAFCEGDAPPALDPHAFEAICPSGAPALLASVKSPVPGNAVPTLAEDAARAPEGCVAPDAPDQALAFRFEDAQREPGEELLLGMFVTGGELDRTYEVLEATEPAPKTVSVPWKPPASEGDVRVFFVLRDGRGGTSFVARTVCVRR